MVILQATLKMVKCLQVLWHGLTLHVSKEMVFENGIMSPVEINHESSETSVA